MIKDLPITDAQRASAERVIARYEMEPDDAFITFGDVLMLIFPFITIGIEPDGYAHS